MTDLVFDDAPPAPPPPPARWYRVLKTLSPAQGPLIEPGAVVELALSEAQIKILVDEHQALERIDAPVPGEEGDELNGNIDPPAN